MRLGFLAVIVFVVFFAAISFAFPPCADGGYSCEDGGCRPGFESVLGYSCGAGQFCCRPVGQGCSSADAISVSVSTKSMDVVYFPASIFYAGQVPPQKVFVFLETHNVSCGDAQIVPYSVKITKFGSDWHFEQVVLRPNAVDPVLSFFVDTELDGIGSYEVFASALPVSDEIITANNSDKAFFSVVDMPKPIAVPELDLAFVAFIGLAVVFTVFFGSK